MNGHISSGPAAPGGDFRSLFSSEATRKRLAMSPPKALPVDRFMRVMRAAISPKAEGRTS